MNTAITTTMTPMRTRLLPLLMMVVVAAACVIAAPAAALAHARTSAATPPRSAQQGQPAQTPAGGSVAALQQQAKQAMAEGRFDEAARGYRDLLQAMPNEPGLLMNLGMALAMGGHSRDAIEPLTAATKLQPALEPAWLFLGSAYLDLGQPDQAIAPLRRFVTAQPTHAESRQMLATALLVSGHPGDALTQYQRLTKLTPRDAKTWVGVVQSYDALAQDALEHLRVAQDTNAAAYQQLILAEALEADEKNEQAFALYRRALEAMPRLPMIHDAIARIYDKTGHTVWAAAERGKADAAPLDCGKPGPKAKPPQQQPQQPTLQPSPPTRQPQPECEFRAKRYAAVVTAVAARRDAASYYWRARAYAELGLDAFSHLAGLPPSRELHELKAELFRNEGRHLQSVDELKAALTFTPDDPRLQKELAKSYLLSRDAEHARPLLQTLASHQPDDPEVPLLYGEILLDAQQIDEALPYLRTAATRDPSSINAHAALGRALVQAGQHAEAIPHLKAALPQDEDGSLHYQLARAYQATGQPDLAKPLLDEYQKRQRATQSQAQTAPEAKITPP